MLHRGPDALAEIAGPSSIAFKLLYKNTFETEKKQKLVPSFCFYTTTRMAIHSQTTQFPFLCFTFRLITKIYRSGEFYFESSCALVAQLQVNYDALYSLI